LGGSFPDLINSYVIANWVAHSNPDIKESSPSSLNLFLSPPLSRKSLSFGGKYNEDEGDVSSGDVGSSKPSSGSSKVVLHTYKKSKKEDDFVEEKKKNPIPLLNSLLKGDVMSDCLQSDLFSVNGILNTLQSTIELLHRSKLFEMELSVSRILQV
jgi:hypothetical protein